ncbi:putative bromodomain associated domain, histone-fold protein [Helianthus debilis subsp. tardiflorus]
MNNATTESSSKKKKRNNSDFVQSLARIAVAQICETLGFRGFQHSALDTLSVIACKYIQDIGKLSNFYAELAGRTESNVFDIVHGLEDLGILQGFVGGSGLDRSLSQSGIVNQISRFIDESEEVASAYSVPSFPVVKEREFTPSFFRAAETPPDNIPPWLPCFPDPETYTVTSSASASIEQSETKKDEVDRDQKVEMLSLLRADERLVCSGFNVKVPFVIKAGRGSGKGQVNNPFLASALEYGEMKVSLVSLPARLVEEEVARNHSVWAKHVSSLWTFAPVIHGFKSSDLETYEAGSKEISVGNRPAVRLKFNTRKKSSVTANKHRKREVADSMPCFAIDDSRNDGNMIKEKIEDVLEVCL